MTSKTLFIIAACVVGSALVAGIVVASRGSRADGKDVMAASGAGAAAESKGKQLYTCGMHPQVVQDHPGNCPICHMHLTPMRSNGSDGTEHGHERKVLYWWDPMLGPSSIADKPGKSAMGMDRVPVYADEAGPKVTIDPTVVQNMGVRTAEVTRGPLAKTVRTVGLLKLPEPGLHDVTLKIGGYIDKLYADQEGMHVREGEPLFDLYSQDLQVASEELIAAVRSERSLGKDAAPALRQEAQGLIDSARRKLGLWDVAEADIDAIAKSERPPKDVPFRSPATGHVEEKMVVQGSSVQPGMKLLRVADHTKMWLEAQVYEGQLPVVKVGDEVVASVEALPGRTFKGAITFMYPHLDPTTRTLAVRMTLDNPEFALKPGMYATADIVTRPLADAVQVPREAVIDTGTRQIAFVAEGEGHFDPRQVRMGLSGDDGRVQIVEGLAPGETVVTSGQFLMDVESRTTEAIQKLRKGGASTMAAMPMTKPAEDMPATSMASPASDAASRPATGPVTAPDSEPSSLSVAFCPMAKADWLQPGSKIANPYLGPEMADCGDVKRQVAMAPSGSPLAPVVRAYLDLGAGLNAGKVDVQAVQALKSAADMLAGDSYAPLRQSADRLAAAGKDLKAVRATFQVVSRELIAALERSAK